MNIKQLAALFGGVSYREVAVAVWPKGVRLVCQCGHEESATSLDCAKYLKEGWPKHCKLTMNVEPVE